MDNVSKHLRGLHHISQYFIIIEERIDVRLSAGLDGSIIIDGTEYCPGKQGINIVSLDFIRYKYSKGKVLQPHKLEDYMVENYIDTLKKWDPVFIVTQGDCTVVNDETGACSSLVLCYL